MKTNIRKGFHIPFHFTEDEIVELGKKLIEPGYYDWIEIKWPHNYIGFHNHSYIYGIKHLIDTYNIGVSCHIPTNLDLGQTTIFLRKTLIEEIKKCIDYAHEMKASIMPVHPGTILTFDPPATDETEVKKMLRAELINKKKNARDLSVSVIKEIAEYAKQYNITIAVENLLLPQEICYKAEELNEIVALCDMDNVKALYDCGHAHRVKEDVGEFVKILGKNLCHVHFNDNDSTCDLHLQLKEGNIDYESIFKSLYEINYHGAIIMETSYKNADDLIISSNILDEYMKKYGELL